MNNKTVLITSIGSTTAIGITHFIRQYDPKIQIIGTDTHQEKEIAGSSFVNKFYTLPDCRKDNYINLMHNILLKHCVNYLIPVHDLEIHALTENRALIEQTSTRLISSSLETVKNVNNKKIFSQILEKNNILSPKSFTINEWLELNNQEDIWILKPIQGVSSRGIIIGASKDIIYKINEKAFNKDDFIIQEYLKGLEYTVDMFIKNKKIYACVPRERIEVRDGICYRARTVKNDNFLPIVEKIINIFDFYGPINIQFIEIDSTFYCIEVNPRFAGTSIITLESGINLFKMIDLDQSGCELNPETNYKKIIMTRYWEEVYYES